MEHSGTEASGLDATLALASSTQNLEQRARGNFLVTPLARLGLAGRRTHILSVRGRKSALRYSTPVQLVIGDGAGWLVAPSGEREWVKNARRRRGGAHPGRQDEADRIEEVGADGTPPVLRTYLRTTRIVRLRLRRRRQCPA